MLYPPLIRCLKIELVRKSCFSSQTIATEYIYVDELSNPLSTADCLPSFGPSYIYLYEEPFQLSKEKIFKSDFNLDFDTECKKKDFFFEASKLNTISLSGFAGKCDKYVARLRVQIESNESKLEDEDEKPLDNQNYLLFAFINDATVIHPSFKHSQIRFKLSIGDACDTENSVTEDYYPNCFYEDISYIPFDRVKPILHIELNVDDISDIRRMRKSNFLKRRVNELVCERVLI